MRDQIPTVFLETADGVPNPADGSSDSLISFVPVWQKHPLRDELGLGLDTAIMTIKSLRRDYPGYTYVADLTQAEAPRPIEVPKLRYDEPDQAAPPRVHETTTPPGAPKMFVMLPLPSPMIQMELEDGSQEDSNQVARANSPVWDVPTKMLIWRRRMIHEESGFSLKILWHPKKGEIITTEHPRTLSFKAADKYRATALKLLQEVEKRGRPNGPAGFKDAQAFEDTVVHLIQTAHAKGQGTQQERIAELLRPVLVSRRAGIGSAASVDVTAKSTARLIHMHTSCSWRALVKKALQPL